MKIINQKIKFICFGILFGLLGGGLAFLALPKKYDYSAQLKLARVGNQLLVDPSDLQRVFNEVGTRFPGTRLLSYRTDTYEYTLNAHCSEVSTGKQMISELMKTLEERYRGRYDAVVKPHAEMSKWLDEGIEGLKKEIAQFGRPKGKSLADTFYSYSLQQMLVNFEWTKLNLLSLAYEKGTEFFSIFEPTPMTTKPSSPNLMVCLLFGVGVGFLVGLVIKNMLKPTHRRG